MIEGVGRTTWVLLLAGLMCGAAAQGLELPAAPANPTLSVTLPPAMAPSVATAGGVAVGQATAGTVTLTLDGAIQMGLRNNLGTLLAGDMDQQARAQRMAALAALLPRVDGGVSETRQTLNLAAFGISFPGVPQIVGPFNLFEASAAATLPVLNLNALDNTRAAGAMKTATTLNLQATRDLVVLAVANQYLLSVADESRVEAAQAQLATAESQLTQAQDMLKAGTVDALVAVRAQVERDQQRQQLTAQQDALAKQRLQLARAIGLPAGQAFTLASAPPFAPLAAPETNTAVAEALATRPDYRAATASDRAARLLLSAADAERLPSFSLNGAFGTVGHTIDNNHDIFSIGASLNVPIFAGGLYRADRVEAQAQVRQADSRLADLRAQIEVQVRSALLDLSNDQAQVTVAEDAQKLAHQELTLAEDRFKAGVADNLEVVEAEQSVAEADESAISSLYGYTVAKAQLAQALGVATSSYQQYLDTH